MEENGSIWVITGTPYLGYGDTKQPILRIWGIKAEMRNDKMYKSQSDHGVQRGGSPPGKSKLFETGVVVIYRPSVMQRWFKIRRRDLTRLASFARAASLQSLPSLASVANLASPASPGNPRSPDESRGVQRRPETLRFIDGSRRCYAHTRYSCRA